MKGKVELQIEVTNFLLNTLKGESPVGLETQVKMIYIAMQNILSNQVVMLEALKKSNDVCSPLVTTEV